METSLKINLESFPERFANKSRELLLTKKINFIFGKNGTGKTTIADTIKSQQQDSYQVCIFSGFDGVVGENERLEAVALGTENTKIQTKIDAVDVEIVNIKKEIEQPVDKSENIFIKLERADKKYKEQSNKIEKFYSDSAQIIKNQTNPQIAKTSYDKNSFKEEISSAELLSSDDIKKHNETIKSEKKNDVSKINFPEIILSDYQKSTNTILQSKVFQQQIISELQGNTDKQNFAREGLRIHQHENDEKCAFCGNEISDDRWKLLGGYFNDEVKKLETGIDDELKKIDSELKNIDFLREINRGDFYDKFGDQIKNINLQIKNTKGEHKTFLGNLNKALEDKKKNLFTLSKSLTDIALPDFSSVKTDYEKIVDKNNLFSKNLNNEQETAKNVLRFHEVKKALNTFKYDEENWKISTLKTSRDGAEKALNDKKGELVARQIEKSDLISQTKDEKEIARKINELLKNMGACSFSIELVTDTDESQKGQYKIKGHDGDVRHITKLSKGEKNIIAFLYFIFSLEKVDSGSSKPKIVVFDDPMTSNDDTMQYLMISEIQKFYRNLNDGNYFLFLTHNCHFYLNVRPNTATKYKCNDKEISFYEKYGNYCLLSDGKHASIKSIENGKQDFKTNYELLWKEIQFLYEEDNATADIMLNPFRKICETYMKFNSIGIDKFFENNLGVKKLYDVNQHSIDDLEAEQNGRTKDEIKTMLQKLFGNNNASEHFSAYWHNNYRKYEKRQSNR